MVHLPAAAPRRPECTASSSEQRGCGATCEPRFDQGGHRYASHLDVVCREEISLNSSAFRDYGPSFSNSRGKGGQQGHNASRLPQSRGLSRRAASRPPTSKEPPDETVVPDLFRSIFLQPRNRYRSSPGRHSTNDQSSE